MLEYYTLHLVFIGIQLDIEAIYLATNHITANSLRLMSFLKV